MMARFSFASFLGWGVGLALLVPWPMAQAVRQEPTLTAKKENKVGDDLELAFLGEQQLLRVTVRVELDGRPLATGWEEAFQRLFKHLDRDGNNKLDRQEATRVPSALRVRQLSWGYFFALADTAVAWTDLAEPNDATDITPKNLADYYCRHGLGIPLLGAGTERGGNPLTGALLRHLDRDGDGRVGREEWQGATERLAVLDLNEDEVISPGELVADAPYPSTQGNTLVTPPARDDRPSLLRDSFPLMPLPTNTSDPVWAQAVIRRRDRSGDGKLDREESRLPPTNWKVLDTDSDGKLDAHELIGWRKQSADQELVIRLGRRDESQAALECRAGLNAVGQARQGELLRVKLGGSVMVLGSGTSRLLADFATFQKTARQRWAEADQNADGQVDETEAGRSTYAPLRTLFALADRNGDRNLTATEWSGWLDVEKGLLAGQVVLSVVDQGRGLFEFLDADRDGQLSRRELTTAWSRLETAGCTGTGGVVLERLPLQLVAAVGIGPQKLPPALVRHAGPSWFRAMDRNHDGDVSRKEFVSKQEDFTRLDTDSDGLISAQEAERAGATKP